MRSHWAKLETWGLGLLAGATLVCAAPLTGAQDLSSSADRYTAAVRAFADTILAHGRDTYGAQHTPLFVDGLQAETFEPVRWKKGGRSWVLCNFASQQSLLRTLVGLSALTKDDHYRQAAEEATRYALQHLRSTNGLLYWGGHMAWDLKREQPVGEYRNVHELKNNQPFYALFWRVDPPATRQLLETIWAGHVLDWSTLDYNRHAGTEIPVRPQWNHPFNEHLAVPFPSIANNLSFVNVTPPLLDAGVTLAVLDRDTNALLWTPWLIYRWQQARDPKTGLCGGQLSYRKEDRAQEALGHVHPAINEAKIVASYHRVGRYHHLPLAQMQAGEQLIAAGGAAAETGREFIRWAGEDLKVYAKYCYQPETGRFISLMTDGTPIQWQQARAGYYDSNSFAPAKPEGYILWGYAMAYRLTQEPAHWRMARQLAQGFALGDIGQPGGAGRQLRFDTSAADWRYLYALAELARATDDQSFLRLACRIADNLLQRQTKTGLFPRPGRLYARTGDEIPLAVLHLAATLRHQDSLLPPAVLDNAYFHCQYDGLPGAKNPNVHDKRTYDNTVFYGEK
jgi:pectate lyase